MEEEVKEIITDEEEKIFWSALTLPEDYAEATDFEAGEAIEVDYNAKLPDFFSLWKWIYKTSNQWALGSCTAMGTTHWVQILKVKKNWVEPKDKNIITPKWKDLWGKMWHDIEKYDGGDYVEKAVSTALKEGILIEEDWTLAKFDAYATDEWNSSNYDKSIDKMKRYLYKGCPIVWCVRGDKKMRNEMSAWEVKTVPATPTWGHCIALVGWDANGFWFINSRSANDDKKLKSRFYISFNTMKKLGLKFNYRYWVLYIKEDAKVDPEYLKRKNVMKVVIEVLKKQYNSESKEMQQAIVNFSQVARKLYPEINQELPL